MIRDMAVRAIPTVRGVAVRVARGGCANSLQQSDIANIAYSKQHGYLGTLGHGRRTEPDQKIPITSSKSQQSELPTFTLHA